MFCYPSLWQKNFIITLIIIIIITYRNKDDDILLRRPMNIQPNLLYRINKYTKNLKYAPLG